MTLEVGRRYVNGEWVTNIADETPGSGGGVPDGGTTGQVLTKASNADQDVDWEPSGGSSPFTVVRVPIAFDTPNLAVQAFPITVADPGTGTFTIAGDHTALFPPAATFTVSGSSLNDGTYTVTSATLNGGNTEILTVEGFADNTADGNVVNAANGATTAGITLYTPAAGELWLVAASSVSVPAAFDGSTTTLFISPQDAADYQNGFVAFSGIDLTVPDIDQTTDATGAVTKPTDYLASTANAVWLFNDATPLRLVVDDGSNGAPGSTQGEGEVVLLVLAAA